MVVALITQIIILVVILTDVHATRGTINGLVRTFASDVVLEMTILSFVELLQRECVK